MKMKRIAPKMDGMHEVEGMYVITLEATESEARRVGHLLCGEVSVVDLPYVVETDLLSDFLEENFHEVDDGQTPCIDAYEAYHKWFTETRGSYVISMKRFAELMEDKGLKKIKRGGRWYYTGLVMKRQPSKVEEG